jgi:stalled ribosome rescue protein Dom34
MDHKEAKIYQIQPETFELSKISAPHQHVTRKAHEQGKHTDAHLFFGEVTAMLQGADEILIVGPSSAKLDFIRHLHQHDRALESKVLGVETLDHPTDGQMVAYVRHYFKAADRMGGTGA